MATSNYLCTASSTDKKLHCPLCLHVLESPFTLQECLHTFCKGCLDEHPKITKDNITGWDCPRCSTFSKVDGVELNSFMQKLIDKQSPNSDRNLAGKVICKQCMGTQTEEAEAKWKCNDCRLELCSNCKTIHFNIPFLKDHKIVTLDAKNNNESAVDEIVFCKKHPEKILMTHCKGCNVPLCHLCHIKDHNTHEIETVEDCLTRLLPELDKYTQTIKKKLEHFRKMIQTIRSVMEETKKSYANTRKQVQDRYKQLLTELKAMKCECEESVTMKENEALKILEKAKLDLEAKVEETDQLMNMASLMSNNALNVSLLTELQAGLFAKVKRCSKVKSTSLKLSVMLAELVLPGNENGDVNIKNIFGQINETGLECTINWDGWKREGQYICQDLATYFNQTSFSLAKEIDFQSEAVSSIMCTDNNIWVLLDRKIQLYDLAGNLQKEISVPFFPTSVKELGNSELVFGTWSGLYVSDMEMSKEFVKLKEGHFSDVVYDDKLYGLQGHPNEIVVFSNNQTENSGNKSCTSRTWYTDYTLKLLFMSPSFENNTICRLKEAFAMSSLIDKCIFLCDNHGNLLNKLMSGHQCFLCGLDTYENIIITSYTYRYISLLNWQQKEVLKTLEHELERGPGPVKLDSAGDLWMLLATDGIFTSLVKYEV